VGLFDKLKQGLARTAQQIAERFDDLVRRTDTPERRSRALDPDTIESLEEVLLMADVGVAASRDIVQAVARRQRRGESLRQLVREEILEVLSTPGAGREGGARGAGAGGVGGAGGAAVEPIEVVLVVGVNGTGKTTTVGKLANRFKQEGRRPLICAADTFRAAAVDQLQIWADRAGVDMVRAREGADPAAVVYDALSAGRARKRDVVLVDTAGRLHTRTNLMQELEKIRRIASREVPGAPHETLLVLDATVGQNGLAQAREFTSVAGVTGIVLTKLDGTAKGGVAVAIAHDLEIPIRYVGVGEGIDDLLPFSPAEYVDALFVEKW
jgi:fused signal recognition particle receptor